MEIFDHLVEFDSKTPAQSTHKMKLDQHTTLSTSPSTVKASDEVRISEEYEKLMAIEFEQFSDKEEFLQERAAKIVHLKKQYEEYEKSKAELEEFASEGKRDLEKTVEAKHKELERVMDPKRNELGFRVNWHPLNEKVKGQVLKIKKSWSLSVAEAKQWFYIIRREEIKLKKAKEIM